MKKLHIIATGGTIACVPSPNGLMPGLGAKELLEYVPGGHKIEYTDLFHMDSSNIQPEEWQQMAKAVIKARESCSGIVITHGTDTMAYTASMLSFMLRDIDIPVVLTGSQYPIVRPDSDGRKNLHNAIIAASELTGGVYIAFGDAVIKGCRAVKTRTTSLNAFESINYPYIGAVANGGFISFVRPEPRGEFSCFIDIDPRVVLIKLIPGTSPAFLESVASCGIKGVVVEAFGLGGLHYIRRNLVGALHELSEKGVVTLVATQCMYEKADFSIYEVGRDITGSNIYSARDMTTEAAVAKLMWVLGKPDVRKELLRQSLCLEMS